MRRLRAVAVVSSRVGSAINWNPDQISGSVACRASATAAMDTMDAVSIVQPASHAAGGRGRRVGQL